MSTALLCPATWLPACNLTTLQPRSLPKGPSDPTMDPFSLSTGIVGLVAFALKLVVGTLGMIDKTVAAYDEATDELEGLQQDLEQLQTQMVRIHEVLEVLASNTKDRGFKKLITRYAPQVDMEYF